MAFLFGFGFEIEVNLCYPHSVCKIKLCYAWLSEQVDVFSEVSSQCTCGFGVWGQSGAEFVVLGRPSSQIQLRYECL